MTRLQWSPFTSGVRPIGQWSKFADGTLIEYWISIKETVTQLIEDGGTDMRKQIITDYFVATEDSLTTPGLYKFCRLLQFR